MPQSKRILIAGGGVVGLALGWQLLRRDFSVEIFEKGQAGHGASWAAAGMLAPYTEGGYEDQELTAFSAESLRLYPKFLEELEQDSGQSVSLQTEGTLVVALDRDEAERLQRFFDFRVKQNLPVQWLGAEEARGIEPFLSPNLLAAVSIPSDVQIDPRELVSALRIAFQRCGGKLHEFTAVKKVRLENEKISGLEIQDDEQNVIDADAVVIAAGCRSNQIEGLPEENRPRVRPVKGQILRMRAENSCQISHVIRRWHHYLVPKPGGRILVGTTSEEMGFDDSPTCGPIMDMLNAAFEMTPGIYDCVLEEIQVGLRPGSFDKHPILGASAIPNLYYACGHYRSGILLAPVTAYEMANLMATGEAPKLAAFSPNRFSPTLV